MGTTPATTAQPQVTKHFTSSVLLWVRTEQARQTGMDYWKGPHSGIIAATPGLEEYRQIHLAEHNPGLFASPSETVGARTVIYLRRRPGVRPGEFRRAVKKELVPALADTGMLKELRTQSFMPWIKRCGTHPASPTTTRRTNASTHQSSWDSPNRQPVPHSLAALPSATSRIN